MTLPTLRDRAFLTLLLAAMPLVATCGGTSSVDASPDPIAQVALSVTRNGSGVGTVTSKPAGINCGPVCTASFPVGNSVTLTAVAALGSAFIGWSGGCSGADNPCTVTSSGVNGAGGTNVVASFHSTACASPPPSAPAWPNLSEFFTAMSPQAIASSYSPRFISGPFTADLNGDGNDDLVVLGVNYPSSGDPMNVPQPGRIFLGDGNGNFAAAPSDLFPVATLKTVHPRSVLFADFNGDRRLDMFVAAHGWDTQPYPGEQNLLFLSQPSGGWKDATATLPQLSDYSHSAAYGDIRGRGVVDIVVDNYFAPQPNHVVSYALLNDGAGLFTLSRSIIPVASGQTMDSDAGNYSLGVTLTDLDRDGLPELVVVGDGSDAGHKLRQTTILWNRSGAFNDAVKTRLPEPSAFATHIGLDAQSIDVNKDGLPDLVIVGSQGQPFYDGWFVQLLINFGNGIFVDETACRLSAADSFGGTPGAATGAPWAKWVKVIDFNGDGFSDFAVEYFPPSSGLPRQTPVVYLNDRTGHFQTLKVADLVAPGNESVLGGGHLVPTRNGYSFVTPQLQSVRQTLILTGLLAAKPFRLP